MKFLIDSYDAYMVGGGLLDKGWQVVNWFFVGLPFFFLKLCVSFFLFCESVLNQSDYFIAKQAEMFDMSVQILRNFGGTGFGRGTLMGLAIMLSAYYLLYHFFSNRHNFSQSLLHYVVVLLLFFGWFGQITTRQGTYNTSSFFIQSVNSIVKTVQNQFISGTNYGSDSDQSPMFDATVKQTFYFVNSGSLDGTMENGEKLDEAKLLQVPNLSKEEKETFKKDREQYIDSLENENPYFAQDGSKTMEKSFAIWVGVANLFILALPVLYINMMLTIIQILVNLLILAFPILALASFFPRCQMLMFKFFKTLIGILFMPVIYGVFISVLFWVNQLIDQVFLHAAQGINENLLNVLSGSILLLGTRLIMVLVKIVFISTVWKNRYRILGFFADGQIQQPIFEKKVNEKTKEGAEQISGASIGAAQLAAGAYTGNPNIALNGLSKILPDKAMTLGKEHFLDEENQFTGVKQGLGSLFRPSDYDDTELSIPEEDKMEMDQVDQQVEDEVLVDEEVDDKALEDVLAEINEADPTFDQSLSESDALVSDDVLMSDLSDSDLTNDTEALFEQDEVAMSENEIPIDPTVLSEKMNVTVDNFDELQLSQEEQAYFDHAYDPELIANYSSEVEPIHQIEENFKSLESEETFFDAWEEEQQEPMEDW